MPRAPSRSVQGTPNRNPAMVDRQLNHLPFDSCRVLVHDVATEKGVTMKGFPLNRLENWAKEGLTGCQSLPSRIPADCGSAVSGGKSRAAKVIQP